MELGSEFELDISNLRNTEDTIFQYLSQYNTIYMDSGRSASAVLNMVLASGTILLPSYICESVIKVYKKQFKVDFYRVRKDFTIDLEDLGQKLNENVTAVYVMHYFGQLQEEQALKYLSEKKQQYGFTIIEDTTHSIFTRSRTIGDYCICSLRKWFPIMDGGVLYSENGLENISVKAVPPKNPSEKLEAMILKKLYIEGKVDCNELYRKIFVNAEEKLDKQKEVYQISDLSRSLLQYFSVTELIEKRKKNYRELSMVLKVNNIQMALKEDERMVPLACPVYIENRDSFRQYLSKNQVYCAVHWPLTGTELEEEEEAMNMSGSIISLPIDQRYDEEHMQYLQNIIMNYKQEMVKT